MSRAGFLRGLLRDVYGIAEDAIAFVRRVGPKYPDSPQLKRSHLWMNHERHTGRLLLGEDERLHWCLHCKRRREQMDLIEQYGPCRATSDPAVIAEMQRQIDSQGDTT